MESTSAKNDKDGVNVKKESSQKKVKSSSTKNIES
jgi:hypothetical protein